jgi:hypothetical protein
VCRPALQPLIDTKKNLNLTIKEGAELGTLAHAGMGGRTESGARAGMLVGGQGGYYKGKVAQQHTRQGVLASINKDAGRDVAQMQTSISAIDHLVSCRDAEISGVESQFRANAITRDQAVAAMNQIRSQLSGDDELIAEVIQKSKEHADTYLSARALAPELPPEPTKAVVSTSSVDLLVITNQQATAAKAKLQQPVNRVADFLTARNELL